jgi:hypothetical protein
VSLHAFAVTGTPGQRGGAAGSIRLETRRAPPSGDRVGVGLDQERGDLERPGSHGRRADPPGAGGDDRKRVPAPVGDTAVIAGRRGRVFSLHRLAERFANVYEWILLRRVGETKQKVRYGWTEHGY